VFIRTGTYGDGTIHHITGHEGSDEALSSFLNIALDGVGGRHSPAAFTPGNDLIPII
jgi:hypothetical protein